MKNMTSLVLITVFITAFTAITAYISGNEQAELQDRIDTLEMKKEEQRKDKELAVEVERIKTFAEYIPDDYNISGYDSWLNAQRIADHLFIDSEEKFEKDWGVFLVLEAERKEIDPLIVYELLKIETGGTFDPESVGPETKYGHAYGMSQFMENTAPWIADMADLPYEHEMLFDPYYSIQLSIVYLDFLYKQYDDWNHALTAYHRGMYGLENYIEENGDAKSWYAVEILENAEENSIVAFDQ